MQQMREGQKSRWVCPIGGIHSVTRPRAGRVCLRNLNEDAESAVSSGGAAVSDVPSEARASGPGPLARTPDPEGVPVSAAGAAASRAASADPEPQALTRSGALLSLSRNIQQLGTL